MEKSNKLTQTHREKSYDNNNDKKGKDTENRTKETMKGNKSSIYIYASKNVWCTEPKLIVYVKQNTILEQQKIRLKQGITTTKSPLSIACMKRKQNSQNISGN